MSEPVFQDAADSAPNPPTTPSKFDRASFLASKLKSNVKQIVKGTHGEEPVDSDEDMDMFEDAAFNPQQVLAANPHESGSLRDKLHRGAHEVVSGALNPRRAMRKRYAVKVVGNISSQPQAYDRKHDKELVDAHDALQKAHGDARRGSNSVDDMHGRDLREDEVDGLCDEHSSRRDMKNDQVASATERLRQVEDKRDSLRSAWILGRHVRRVRVAKPRIQHPSKLDFYEHNPETGQQRFRWDRYLGQLALWHTNGFTPYHIDDFDELPFDLKDLSLAVERVAVVSAPWQNYLVEVRNIYLWTDPKRTLKIMTAYWILWYFQHIMTAVFAWIIYSTVSNKLRPTRIELVRQRNARAEDNSSRARAWGEMIQRHGQHEWVEPLLDEVGPMLQMECSDLANILEIMLSFYRWDRPKKTLATLFFFACCFTVSLLADMAFCVKFIWLGAGMLFFFSLPIAAKYPKYRRLVNPIYWVFWDIPNMAELAIIQLQEKAILRDADKLENWKASGAKVEDDEPSDFEESETTDDEADVFQNSDRAILKTLRSHDHITFRAVHAESHAHGRLRVGRTGFWYFDKKLKSFYPYSRLSEVRKVDFSEANNASISKKTRFGRRVQEATSLQFLPSGIEFVFYPSEKILEENSKTSTCHDHDVLDELKLSLTVSETDRDKIFSLVISWSNLKWRPLFFLNRRNHLSSDAHSPMNSGEGNVPLDKAIKSVVK